jgi:hypothetical protein
MHYAKAIVFCLFLLGLSPALAENSTRADGYVVHHNAFAADFITPEVAARYGIQRSRNRGLLNVSVIKEEAGTTGRSVTAVIQVQANNLAGLVKTLQPREIREQEAIYYIADFPVIDGEIVNFTLEVTPEGAARPIRAKLTQDFYTR